MVIGKITSYLALGLIGAFLLNTLIRPSSAIQSGAALGVTGSGIASIGSGIGSTLSALGQGGAALLQPLWEIKNLIYSAGVSTAAGVGAVNQSQGTGTNPTSGTITWSNGSDSSTPTYTPSTGGADLSSLGAQDASGGGFGAAN